MCRIPFKWGNRLIWIGSAVFTLWIFIAICVTSADASASNVTGLIIGIICTILFAAFATYQCNKYPSLRDPWIQ